MKVALVFVEYAASKNSRNDGDFFDSLYSIQPFLPELSLFSRALKLRLLVLNLRQQNLVFLGIGGTAHKVADEDPDG